MPPTKLARAVSAGEYLGLPALAAFTNLFFFEHVAAMPRWACVLDVAIVFATALGVALATARPRLAFAATVLGTAVIHSIDDAKLRHLDAPLFLTDLLGWRTALATAWHYFSWRETGVVIGLLAAIVLLPVAARFFPRVFPRRPLPWAVRTVVALIVLAFFASFLVAPNQWQESLAKRGRGDLRWEPKSEAAHQGLLLTQLLALPALDTRRPADAEEGARRVLAAYGNGDESRSVASERPDVVLYLMESFADPTDWGFPLTRDPIAHFHALAREQSGGVLETSRFGGGTANVEFEILTGYPAGLFPAPGVYPYQSYLHRDVEAVPALFGRAGYRTVAVHPNVPSFWARDRAYPYLGFQQFVSARGFPATGSPWKMPDDVVVDRTIAQLLPETPSFVFALTIETHGPYGAPPPKGVAPFLAKPGLRDAPLEDYLQRIHRADQALGRLVEKLRARKRPAILVAFGDHLPAIPTLWNAIPEDDPRRFRVPVLRWRSDGKAGARIDVSTLNFGSSLLRWSDVALSPRFRFFEAASSHVRSIRNGRVFTANGAPFPLEASRGLTGDATTDRWLGDYWLLQYQAFFGTENR